MRRLIVVTAMLCAAASVAGAQSTESEPNGLVRQATGPLLGGPDTTARLTGSADRDWFFFYARQAGDFLLTVTNTSAPGECGFLQVALLDTNAEALESFGMEAGDDPKTVPRTAAGHERYYVRVEREAGCPSGAPATYAVRVDPSGAITTEAPPGLRPPACQDARDRLGVARKALRRARRGGSRRKVRAAQRRVTSARRAVARSC